MQATDFHPATDSEYKQALRIKTRIFAVIVVLSNVAGDAALRTGMDGVGDLGYSPVAFVAALFHPWVALGVALLIVWTFSHMTLLSWADLSYVVPVTAIGYVLNALAGRFLLQEHVTAAQWLGVALITGGVIVAGSSEESTR